MRRGTSGPPPHPPRPPRSANKQQMGAPARIGDGSTFLCFKTDTYKLHFFESPSGLKVRGDSSFGSTRSL